MANVAPSLISDEFLSIVKDKNKNIETFCQEEKKDFHNSEFIWCEKCDKVICTNCSYEHLMKNQIVHRPIEAVFFNKEKLDIEYQRNKEKLKKFEEISNKYFKILSTLYFIYKSFHSFSEGMCKFLSNLKNKLDKKLSLLYPGKLKEFEEKYEIINSTLLKLKDNYENIQKNYFQKNNFNAKLIKNYFYDLKKNHEQFIKIYKYSETDLQKYENVIKDQNKDNINLHNLISFVDNTVKKLNPILEEFLKNETYINLIK